MKTIEHRLVVDRDAQDVRNDIFPQTLTWQLQFTVGFIFSCKNW